MQITFLGAGGCLVICGFMKQRGRLLFLCLSPLLALTSLRDRLFVPHPLSVLLWRQSQRHPLCLHRCVTELLFNYEHHWEHLWSCRWTDWSSDGLCSHLFISWLLGLAIIFPRCLRSVSRDSLALVDVSNLRHCPCAEHSTEGQVSAVTSSGVRRPDPRVAGY
jgi:hypothetical protein